MKVDRRAGLLREAGDECKGTRRDGQGWVQASLDCVHALCTIGQPYHRGGPGCTWYATVTSHLPTHALLLGAAHSFQDLFVHFCSRESDLSMEEVSMVLKLARSCTLVLSSCSSGRGGIVVEGVLGLARSFMAVGAGAVVCSLWTISDKSTHKRLQRKAPHQQRPVPLCDAIAAT